MERDYTSKRWGVAGGRWECPNGDLRYLAAESIFKEVTGWTHAASHLPRHGRNNERGDDHETKPECVHAD